MKRSKKLGSKLIALIMALMMVTAYIPMVGDSVYAETVTYTNSSLNRTVDGCTNNYGVVIESDKAEYVEGEDIHVKLSGASTLEGGEACLAIYDISSGIDYTNTTTKCYTYTGAGYSLVDAELILAGDNVDRNNVTVNYGETLTAGTYYIIAMAKGDDKCEEGRWASLPITIKAPESGGNETPIEPSIATDQTTYNIHDAVNVTCDNPASSKDWIGIYKKGETYDPNNGGVTSIFWYYPSDYEENTVDILTTKDVNGRSQDYGVGEFTIVMFSNDSYTPITSVDITVEDCTYSEWNYNEADKTHTHVCAEDPNHTETKDCTFDDGKEVEGGIEYTCTVCSGSYVETHNYVYTYNNDKATHTIKCDGHCDFEETENCKFKTTLNGDVVTFTCQVCEGTYEAPLLETDKTEYTYGDAINVTWNHKTSDKDWIGLYKKGETYNPDTGGVKSIFWYYVSEQNNPVNILNTRNENFRSEEYIGGEYKVVMFANDSYTPIATVDITVTATVTEEKVIADPTCEAEGSKLVKYNDGTEKTEAIARLPHELTKTDAKKGTCTEPGNLEYWTCGICEGYFLDAEGKEATTADKVVVENGHKLTKTEAKDSTCTEDGNIEYYTCDSCKKYFKDAEGKTEITAKDVVVAKGHKYETAVTEPTCTESGYTVYKCDCGYEYLADYTDPTGIHIEVVDAAVEPTYEATGLTEGKHCDVCGEVLVAQKTVPALEYSAVPASLKLQLSTANKGYDNVKLSWSAVEGAAGYKVYYKRAISDKWVVKTVEGKTTFTTGNLYDGYKYNFRVVPFIKSGDKVFESVEYKSSNIYTLKKISTPKLSRSGSKVKVRWTNISGETGYQISRSTKKTGTNIVATYKTTSGKSKLVKATKGKKYYYKVRAYKNVWNGKKYVKVYGPWSSVKSYRR